MNTREHRELSTLTQELLELPIPTIQCLTCDRILPPNWIEYEKERKILVRLQLFLKDNKPPKRLEMPKKCVGCGKTVKEKYYQDIYELVIRFCEECFRDDSKTEPYTLEEIGEEE